MQSKIFIFIGQSGAGKGTQVALLDKALRAAPTAPTIFHMETGVKFRELIAGPTYTGKMTKALIDAGKLPPPFLGVHMWAHALIDGYEGQEVVFVDGTPRVSSEVPLLLSACLFYGWETHVINIQVSDEWAHDRITARGRADDKVEAEVWGRIEWFHQCVTPAIELLRQDEHAIFHDIQGEQSIEAVHNDIAAAIGLLPEHRAELVSLE